jgi:hypothetical protein
MAGRERGRKMKERWGGRGRGEEGEERLSTHRE